ncbi:MAG: hypothetical protein CK532_03555 [Flavobacteriales bacterium]|nr:MAG: hypothetical protein CK532_03555 [Flavobacteriales bacterium]
MPKKVDSGYFSWGIVSCSTPFVVNTPTIDKVVNVLSGESWVPYLIFSFLGLILLNCLAGISPSRFNKN